MDDLVAVERLPSRFDASVTETDGVRRVLDQFLEPGSVAVACHQQRQQLPQIVGQRINFTEQCEPGLERFLDRLLRVETEYLVDEDIDVFLPRKANKSRSTASRRTRACLRSLIERLPFP